MKPRKHRDKSSLWYCRNLALGFQNNHPPALSRPNPISRDVCSIAETVTQLLYLPSLGACVLAGCILRRRTAVYDDDAIRNSPNAGQTRTEFAEETACANPRPIHSMSHNAPRDLGNESFGSIAIASGAGGYAVKGSVVVEGKATQDRSEASSSDVRFAPANASASTLGGRRTQKTGQQLERRNGQSLCAPSGSSVRDSHSMSSTAKTPQMTVVTSTAMGGGQTLSLQTSPTAAIAYRRKQEKTYNTVSALVLVAWGVYFGAGARHRCEDWSSER